MILPLLMLLATPDDSPRAVVEAMFPAFNRHDAAAVARLYAPQARLTSSDFCAPRTGKDVECTYQALFEAMPDIHDAIEIQTVEGDRIAVRFSATSAAAKFTLPIHTMIRVRAGKIIEDDSVFDTGGRPCGP